MSKVMRVRTRRPLRLTVVGTAVAMLLAVPLVAPAMAEDSESTDPEPGPSAIPPAEFVPGGAMPSTDPDEILGDLPSDEPSPQLAAILAAHPDSDAVICLAGCGGGPRLVALRKRGTPAPTSSAAPPGAGRLEPASSGLPAGSVQAAPPAEDVGDVICLAGCAGAAGEVVQRNVRLTWIGGGASEELKAALRGIAHRLESGAAPAEAPPRAWMSDGARAHFADAPMPPELAALIASAPPPSRR